MLSVDLRRVMVLDVETVSQYKTYDELPQNFKELWNNKSGQLAKHGENPADMYNRAAIYAEFGKIVCISTGIFVRKQPEGIGFRVKSFYGHDEAEVLNNFGAVFKNGTFSSTSALLCAHNGKEFDFPYLCRRMIINGIEIPPILNIAGRKPWDVPHLDTMELWKFGDYKSYTSLNLLAACLNIPTPKDDIDGSQVGHVYWNEDNIERIKVYCEKDVITTARILMRFCGKGELKDEIVDSIS